MPITLPQLPESMFCSYDPSYVPGYTGYTRKLQSDKGEIYGNATLKSSDYEPGLQRLSQLRVSGWGGNHSPLINVQLGGRTNTCRGDTESWNSKNGYFHPLNGNNHLYKGYPETSSAIKAIEEIKYELSNPARWASPEKATFDSLRDCTVRQSSCHGRNEQNGRIQHHAYKTEVFAQHLNSASASRQVWQPVPQVVKNLLVKLTHLILLSQITGTSSFPSYRNERMKKKFTNDITEKELSTRSYNANDYIQERQGKLIYRTDCGLLPNYSGYIPGQMFAIGNTWGRSSANAIKKLQEQSFQWTSLF